MPGLSQAMQNLTRTSHALQAMVMQVRMIPVEAVFLRFPRLVRDLSTKLGKQVDLKLVGKDTELDRTVVDALGDPLVHLVRNALDHGLEAPDERVAAGKPATGTLEISARHAGGNVIITVADDGRGIDPARVAAKAAERGLIAAEAVDAIDCRARRRAALPPPASRPPRSPSDISGRGVGMDAVRAAIRGLGGEVAADLRARPGHDRPDPPAADAGDHGRADRRGRRAPVRDPARPHRAHRPRSPTTPSARSPAAACWSCATACCRSSTPAERLRRRRRRDAEYAVVVRGGGDRFALTVDRLVGQRELVTRPLPPEVADGAALSGAAVLSDGQIALIVDCDAVVDVPVSA